MRLPPAAARGVADGTVTLAFRGWSRPNVKPGATFVTSAGVVRVEDVTPIDPATVTDEEARAAGHPDADAVRRWLARTPDHPAYRIALSWAGPDPRIALREEDDLTDDDLRAVDARLERLDRASTHGPWTMATLDVIRRRPRTRAPDLANELGRERDPFKIDVRKLKALGLTRSFEVGYELSPRGRAYLARSRRAAAGGTSGATPAGTPPGAS